MIECAQVYVVDGDTLRCDRQRVRLAGIDAPELPGHCRVGRLCTEGDGLKSKRVLARLVARGRVQCTPSGFDRYARMIARCTVGRIDLSCEMVRKRAAVFRYGRIDC